jgi:hypothetical protein
VRRLWVVAGLVGLIGLVVGFSVGARFWVRPWNPNWVEAWGTWFAAIASTVILVILTYRSEKFTRGLEVARRARDDEEARQREQAKADLVFCDIRVAPGFMYAVGGGVGAVDNRLEIEVNNRSGSVVTDVVCELRLDDSEWSYDIDEPIADEPVTRQFPLEVGHYGQELRPNAEFTFSMDGFKWSTRYGQPAVRLPAAV